MVESYNIVSLIMILTSFLFCTGYRVIHDPDQQTILAVTMLIHEVIILILEVTVVILEATHPCHQTIHAVTEMLCQDTQTITKGISARYLYLNLRYHLMTMVDRGKWTSLGQITRV